MGFSFSVLVTVDIAVLFCSVSLIFESTSFFGTFSFCVFFGVTFFSGSAVLTCISFFKKSARISR
ncbi:MAG: hypothetical protein EA412_02420 [Chitinophagaceae bacterium]|nr:MAG: hypothetical protein EA412_02420 [Chitinophagaceae bacterium]